MRSVQPVIKLSCILNTLEKLGKSAVSDISPGKRKIPELTAIFLLYVERWERNMKLDIRSVVCAFALSGMLLTGGLQAQSTQTAPDNTKVNKNNRDTNSATADKAIKNNMSDRQVEAHIRREIVKDKKLSTYAHNIKIVSDNGKVTLKGPVRSEEEKQTVEQYAKKYAADQNVIDELTVKPKS